jgi:hypothetical protein
MTAVPELSPPALAVVPARDVEDADAGQIAGQMTLFPREETTDLLAVC